MHTLIGADAAEGAVCAVKIRYVSEKYSNDSVLRQHSFYKSTNYEQKKIFKSYIEKMPKRYINKAFAAYKQQTFLMTENLKHEKFCDFDTNCSKNIVNSGFYTIFKIKDFFKIRKSPLFCSLSFLKLLHKLIIEFVKLIRAKMIITEKYTNIVLKRGLADSQEAAELLVDTLYQLAFTVVQDYLSKRRN